MYYCDKQYYATERNNSFTFVNFFVALNENNYAWSFKENEKSSNPFILRKKFLISLASDLTIYKKFILDNFSDI